MIQQETPKSRTIDCQTWSVPGLSSKEHLFLCWWEHAGISVRKLPETGRPVVGALTSHAHIHKYVYICIQKTSHCRPQMSRRLLWVSTHPTVFSALFVPFKIGVIVDFASWVDTYPRHASVTVGPHPSEFHDCCRFNACCGGSIPNSIFVVCQYPSKLYIYIYICKHPGQPRPNSIFAVLGQYQSKLHVCVCGPLPILVCVVAG